MKKFVLVLMVFLAMPAVSARYITIAVGTLPNNFINESTGELNLSLSNLGDEPAFDMYLALVVPEGFQSSNLFMGVVEPNNSLSASFTINVSDGVLPGEYYLNLLVQYSDGNEYPFSMVNPIKLVYKNTAKSMIKGSIDKVEIADKESKNIKLKLTNLDDVSHEVKVRLQTPTEIKFDPLERRVSIAGKGEVDVDYQVSLIGALPGSNYLVYAVVDYTDKLHYSTAVRTNVEITKEKALQDSVPLWIPVAVVVILVLVVIYMQLKPAEKQKKRPSK